MTVQFRTLFNEESFRAVLAGNTEALLGREYPYYPMSSPGMPTAGPNFNLEASAILGPVDEATLFPPSFDGAVKTRKPTKKAVKEALAPLLRDNLDYLYFRALYDDEFSLTLDLKIRQHPAKFVLGHIWGLEHADGPRPAKVMVVGKNPAINEINEKRNFAGESGVLLSGALKELGCHDYLDWYITNVVRFANPNAHTGDNTLSASWIKDCLPLLWQEFKLVKPDFVLCLGSEAITAVLGKGYNNRTTSGRVFPLSIPLHDDGEAPIYHEARLMTCIHPAAVARSPERRDDMIKALSRFLGAVGGGVAATTNEQEADREHILVHNSEQLSALCRRIEEEGTGELALDNEWHGDYPGEPGSYLRTTQLSWAYKKAACVVLRNKGGSPHFDNMEAARRLLTDLYRGKRIIGHYLNADLPWFEHMGMGFLIDQFDAPEDDVGAGTDPEALFGWEKTSNEGGFDTMLAAHAHNETADFKLEELGTRYTTMERWDEDLQKWKKEICKQLKINDNQLEGYGDCPDDILLGIESGSGPYGTLVKKSYACCDADGTFRIYQKQNEPGTGLLDCDVYGNCCREAFWRAQRACLAFLEMHMEGIRIDMSRAESLRVKFNDVLNEKLSELRRIIRWPEFNPKSFFHCRELLFGAHLVGRVNKSTGEPIRSAPEGAVCLNLIPYKTTGKKPKLWQDVINRRQAHLHAASTDKESLSVLGVIHNDAFKLRNIRYLSQVITAVLRDPRKNEDNEDLLDEDNNRVYDKGLLSYILRDGRVRSHYSQTKETGRASSWQPPLQNVGKKREKDYKTIMGASYLFPLRSMFVAEEDHVFVEADFVGAELLGMAVQAGDTNMIDHCRRANLPDGHPDKFDIHANVAVKSFRIKMPDGSPCPPTKEALAALGKANLRDAAKPIDFGYAYGMTADTGLRRMKEEGVEGVTLEDARALIQGLEEAYPALPAYYGICRERSQDPGWLVNCFGRHRRFFPTSDDKVKGDQERQAQNFPIQSLVADAMNDALANLRSYRRFHGDISKRRWFRMLVQIHDAVLFEVHKSALDWLVKEVIPICMTKQVDIWPCLLDGTPRYDPAAPYHLSTEVEVMERWSEKLKKSDCVRIGISTDYGR